MSYEDIKAIVKDNHFNGTHREARFFMPESTRTALREKFRTMAAGFTEAAEMGAAKHGLPVFSQILPGLTGMTIHIDESLPPNTWRLVSPTGEIIQEGVVSEGNE